MSRRVGVQAAQEAQVIDVLRHVRKEVRDPCPGLSMLAEFELGRGQQAAAGADLAAVLLKLRLVFPSVELRYRSFHEAEDDPLGLHGEVRRLGG